MSDQKIEPRIICPCCNGSGKGYVGLQDADPCEKCNGETTIPNPAVSVTPVPPPIEDYLGFLAYTTEVAIKGRMHPTLNKVRVASIVERSIQVLQPDWTEKIMDSVASHGFVNPIHVRRVGVEHHLLDGAYRVAAARRLGLEEIDAMVRRCTEHEEWNFRRILQASRDHSVNIGDLQLLAASGIRPLEYCPTAGEYIRLDSPDGSYGLAPIKVKWERAL